MSAKKALIGLVAGFIASSGSAAPVGLDDADQSQMTDSAYIENLKAPNYATPDAWAAFPGRPSHAEDRPEGDTPATERNVAVFFIHPTTYLAFSIGNAPYDAASAPGRRVDDVVLKYQASVFNACCRIYAPRYRQASYAAITGNSAPAYAADDLAYGDVARAFEAFLKLEAGRPFIIAGHSQGSIYAMRLLQEKVIGQPVQRRLVAAYIPGASLPQEIETLGLPICRTALALGCVIAWNSVRDGFIDKRRLEGAVIWWRGSYQPIAGRPIVCVNPLNWEIDAAAPASANLGSLHPGGGPISQPAAGAADAVCQNHLLGVDVAPNERRHVLGLLRLTGVYHVLDYGLYYMNIRKNATDRAHSFK